MMIDPPAAVRGRGRALAIALLSVAAAAVGWQMLALADGYLINNYPFISSDGYDWISEGVYLRRMLTASPPPMPVPVARSPVFVVLLAIDAVFGQRGWVFALVSAAAFLATGWLLVEHWGRFRWTTLVSLAGLTLALGAPVNYFRFYVLADPLCVALSVAAFLLVFRVADERSGPTATLTAGVLTALAGLTQGYGIVAPGVAAVVAAACAGRERRGTVARRVALAWLGGVAATAVGRHLWCAFLPHRREALQLELLAVSTAMIPYYLTTWSYLFLPLALPLLTVRARGIRRVLRDPLALAAWATAAAMALLCVGYQWPSPRYTAFFWPFLVLAVLRTAADDEAPRRRAAVAVVLAGILALAQSTLLIPDDYEAPSLGRQSVAPDRSWLLAFVRAVPVDRMELAARCGGPAILCPAAIPLSGGTPYQQESERLYHQLMFAGGGEH